MVKLHKPNPKTLTKDISKPKKSNNFKKEKLPESKKTIASSNGTAKKEKLKLIEEAINGEKIKASKKEKKDKNTHEMQPPQNEEPIFKKVDKKNKKKAEVKQVTEVLQTTQPETKQKKKKLTKSESQQKPAKAVDDQALPKRAEAKQKKKKLAISDEPKPAKTVVDQAPQKQTESKQKKKKTTISNVQKPKQTLEEQVPQKQKGTKKEKKKVLTSVDKKNAVASKGPLAPPKKGKKKKQKKEKKPYNPKNVIEQVPFDEETFNSIVNVENIAKISKALKDLAEKEVKEKKNSIFEDYRYLLNVAYFKIPNCPKRMVKLNLTHSLVDPNEDDIVIIVPDLKRGAKIDYEPTVQHYEDLLRENGVTGLKIVPFNQLRQECTTFEAKRKFASTYDYFLCDGRIVSHVVGFCGDSFKKARTTFHAVHLNKKNSYKRNIEKTLKRTAYKQLEKGDLISIPVGNHRFTIQQLAENIKLVVDQLKTLCPGGLGNVRNMHIKIDIKGTSSLPFYASLAAAPAETPNVVGMREQRMLKLKKEANEVLSQFNMSKTGEFVKLDKAQAERKRKILEARKSLMTEGLPDNVASENGDEAVPAKKSKKNEKLDNGKKAEKVLEKEESDDEDDDNENEQSTNGTESNEIEEDEDEDDGDDDDDCDDDDDDDDDDDNDVEDEDEVDDEDDDEDEGSEDE